MLFPVAGARFYIADAPGIGPEYVPAPDWVEIGQTQALGLLGGSFEMWDASHLGSPLEDGIAVREPNKGLMNRDPMQIILGLDPIDAGQAILWTGFRSLDPFPFRIVFPDGVTARSFAALIIAMREVYDTANEVMRLQADLQPTSRIQRSEDT